MAINPIRSVLTDFPTPQYIPPSNAFAAGLGDLGASIGRRREQEEVGNILRGAVDPKTGQLDFGKAATAAALAGRPDLISDMLGQLNRRESLDVQRSARDIAAGRLKLEEEAATRPTYTITPGVLGQPGSVLRTAPGQPPTLHGPAPQYQPPPPPTVAPGPQSALPGPNFAAAEPDIENAPPYRVAGPPMPPPQAPAVVAQAAPATPPATTPAPPRAPQKNAVDQYLDTYYPAYANTVRGLLDLSQDPDKVGKNQEERQQLWNLAGQIKRGWSPAQYGERQKAEAPAQEEAKAQATKIGQEKAVAEADAVKDAKAAVELQPLLDAATDNWRKLIEFRRFGGAEPGSGLQTGTGFLAGSTPARLPQKVFGSTEEQLRGAYERSVAQLRARLTATLNKGEGAVSNYERQLYNEILPDVGTVNPGYDYRVLQQLQARGKQVAGVGRETGVGKAVPGYLGERPAIEQPQQQLFDQQTLKDYQGRPRAALTRAQQLLQRGGNPAEVKRALDAIDPSLAPQLGLK